MTASSRRILQFGTSRFLQAHADFFVHEARSRGKSVGPITVVKTTPGGGRDARLAGLVAPGGYQIIIRGLRDGQPVEEHHAVTSIKRAIALHAEPDAVRTAMLEADIILSNTADNGYDVTDADRRPGLVDAHDLPESFPAKFLQLLAHRWRNGARPLAVFPCELIHRNGRVLKALLIDLAVQTGADPAFTAWLGTIPFADSLVDRIVSEQIEPAGAVAEPYAIWAIEKAPGLPCPVEHHCVVMTDDLEPFERLKIHILNLGHTVLADIWATTGRRKDETVREILADAAVADRLARIYADEVIPGFAARGLAAQATDYVATTLERFRNPYLDHRIADIHGNHMQKIERRIVAFRDWSREAGATQSTPELDAIVAQAR